MPKRFNSKKGIVICISLLVYLTMGKEYILYPGLWGHEKNVRKKDRKKVKYRNI